MDLSKKYDFICSAWFQVVINYCNIYSLIEKNKLKSDFFASRFLNLDSNKALSEFSKILSLELLEINMNFFNYLQSCHILLERLGKFEKNYDANFEKDFKILQENKHAIIKMMNELRNGIHHHTESFLIVGQPKELLSNQLRKMNYEFLLSKTNLSTALGLVENYRKENNKKKHKLISRDFKEIRKFIEDTSISGEYSKQEISFEKIFKLHLFELRKYFQEFERLLKEMLKRKK